MGPPMSRDKDDTAGFLSRWSRAKRAAALQPDEAVDPLADAPQDDADAPGDAPQGEEEVDADYIAALPSLDDITKGTDLSAFMRKGVPHALRNAALRRMWTVDPVIRDHLDVARDYFWDWNAPGGVPGGGGIVSAKSAAGMLKDIIGAREEEPPLQAEEAAGPVADADEAPAGPPGETPLNAVESAPEDAADRVLDTSDAQTRKDATARSAPSPQDWPPRQDRPPSIEPRRRHGGALPD